MLNSTNYESPHYVMFSTHLLIILTLVHWFETLRYLIIIIKKGCHVLILHFIKTSVFFSDLFLFKLLQDSTLLGGDSVAHILKVSTVAMLLLFLL